MKSFNTLILSLFLLIIPVLSYASLKKAQDLYNSGKYKDAYNQCVADLKSTPNLSPDEKGKLENLKNKAKKKMDESNTKDKHKKEQIAKDKTTKDKTTKDNTSKEQEVWESEYITKPRKIKEVEYDNNQESLSNDEQRLKQLKSDLRDPAKAHQRSAIRNEIIKLEKKINGK